MSAQEQHPETELRQMGFFPKFFSDLNSNEEPTFSAEDKVAPLPVPDLNHTLDLYLDSVVVHLSPSEYRNTVSLVEEFRRDVGPKLQAKLQQRANTTRNWLADWWEEFAYLRDRSPLIPGANMCGPCPYFYHYWPLKEGSQLFRAAVILHLVTTFRQMIRQERILVDKRGDGSYMSMEQYKHLFNGSREPGIEKDRLLCFFQTQAECSVDQYSYAVVICKGRFYRLEVLDSARNEAKSIPELHLQLQRIEVMSREAKGCEVMRLTALERPAWAKARQHLRSLHPENVKLMDDIDRAAFCLTLDDSSPSLPDGVIESSMKAGEGLIWADKTYSVLVYRNGVVGVSSDHAQLDGISMLATSFSFDVEIYQNKGFSELESLSPANPRQIPAPIELKFVVDSFIEDQIKISYDAHLKAGLNIEGKLRRFRHWGRRQLKTFSVHPDTAVQLALQLAYYRLHDKPAPTYETATTRRFWHGRTETIRSCTPEAVNWCRAMLEPGCSVEEKQRLFGLAHVKHNELRKACEEGRGCDRHLMGLACIAITEQLPMPQLFTDPAFVKSGGNGNFALSTSTLGYASVIGHVKAMTKDGYGCFYRVGVELIEMVVTSFRESSESSSEKLVDAIDVSMKEMLDLLNASSKNNKSKL